MAAPKKHQDERKSIVVNRKARHDYAVLERFEAGISLTGPEVKSCLDNGVALTDSYACVRNGNLVLVGCRISPYANGNYHDRTEPSRDRVLLMHRREILRLKKSVEAKGLTLIPLSLYFSSHHKIKVELGLCRGKNVRDKREDLKKAIDDRETRRTVAGRGVR